MAENAGSIFYEVDAKTDKVIDAGKKAVDTLDDLQDSFDRTDKAATKTGKAASSAGKSIDSMGRQASTGSGSVRQLARETEQLGGGLTRLASSISAVLTISAVIAEFKKAIAVTTEFNATISNLSALTGAVGKDLAVFREAAIEIGGSTSLSATQAAEAMKLIGSASPDLLKSADSLKLVTQQAVALAEAAGSTLPESAAALTGALNQFQLGADQAGRVINVLAAGAKEGASEINDTVAAMKEAGVVAAQSGVNFEQFNGAVQALAQGQIKAGEAGTGLRNILTILNTQAKSELRPSVVGLSTALANLQKAGLDDTQMVKLFGRENITAAKVLLQFRGTMDSVTTAITGTSEAYKQAAINQDNFKGDVAQLSSAFETLQIAVGDLSDSTLRDLTKQLTEVLSAFGNNKEALSAFFETAGTAALSFAAILTGRVVTGIASYTTAQATAIKSTLSQIEAARAAAASNLELARAESALATAALEKTKAIQAANPGLLIGSANADKLAAAETRAAAATVNLNAAMAASESVATKSSLAIGALSRVTAFLGGPVGVFLLAATAVSAFSKESAKARVEVDALNGSLEKLSFNQLSRSSQEIEGQIVDLNDQLAVARNNFNSLSSDKAVMSAESFAKRNTEVKAALDDVNQALALRRARLVEIATAQDRISKPQAAPKDPKITPITSQTSEDGQKALETLKEQLALAKLSGEAKARLQAIQKLGSTATQKEKDEAAALGVEIYKLETATKALAATNKKQKSEAETLAKKSAREEKKGIEDNLETFKKLGVEIASVGKTAREAAQDTAQLSLNKFATPDEVQRIRDMAGALYDLKGPRAALAQADPIAAEQMGYEDQLKQLQTLNDQKLLSDTRYLELKGQAETAHAEQMRVLQEENFKAQTLGNEILLNSIDALSQSATQGIAGIISGTGSLQEALGGIANTVLNTVIGSFVQMGADWVKQQIMMAASAQATTAAQTAGIAAVATTQAGATASIAATTTATAATTGTAVASSMAPAAGLSSIASFGGAAVIGGAALLATMLLAKSFGGGRRAGGAVSGNSVYRVNEGGAPEIFTAGGQQYMIPNQRGQIVNNRDAQDQMAGGGGAAAPIVNINNYSGQAATTTSRYSEADRAFIIDVTVGDGMGGGKVANMVSSITGTKRVGN